MSSLFKSKQLKTIIFLLLIDPYTVSWTGNCNMIELSI